MPDWILVQRNRPGQAIQPFGTFPGQAGNPVGFAAAPGFTGSLSASSGPFTSGSPGNPTIISFKDFDAGTSTTNIDANWVTFIGCRFQSNATGGNCVSTGGTGAQNITFSYCSFTPRVALVGSSSPGTVWPSAGAGLQTTTFVTGTNCISNANGYQFGFDFHNLTDGPVTLDHCDFWGFANAVNFIGHTAQVNVTDCWFHDARNSGGVDHTDGPGYLNSGVPPQNVLIKHCTIASIGTTQGLALQGGTQGYNNIIMLNNFMSGFNVLASVCNQGAATPVNTNLTFTDNIFGTDLPWVTGPLSVQVAEWVAASNRLWRRNTLRFLPGTSPIGGSQFSWSSADDGKFLLPNSTLSVTDYTG